jgi:hypothetical protein
MSGHVARTPLKGSFAAYDYTWVTVPPIREIKRGSAMTLAMQSMKDSFERFDDGEIKLGEGTAEDDAWATKWNDRMNGTRALFDMVGEGQSLNLGYYCFGILVGVICIMDSSTPYVTELVTHPGVANAGEILIEAACNRSAKAGHGGKLELYSLSAASTGFYKAVGFTKDGGDYETGGKMSLDPTGNALWVKLGDHWLLRKYAGQKYYEGRKTPPPLPARKPVTT